MENIIKKITALVVSLIIGSILFAGILLPGIGNAQATANETTYYNTETYAESAKYYNEPVVLTLDSTGATTVADTIIKANGEPITMRNGWNRHIILDSDNLIIEINTNSSTAAMVYMRYTDINGVQEYPIGVDKGQMLTATYSPSTHTITVEYGDNTIVCEASFCFTLTNNGAYKYINSESSFKTQYMSQALIDSNMGGVIAIYSTTLATSQGDISATVINDILGTRVIWDETAYAGEISAELEIEGLTLVEGTTDIYMGGTPKFVVSYDDNDQTTTTPSRSWIAYEVPGHVKSTTYSTLLGVIPLMVIAMLVVFAAAAIRLKY